MDGHDNDVDNTNNTNNSSQGIFSTPELTVDAEKITQNSEAAAESSRAKIASIFANTETGKQAQRLNDAMIANTAPATEDIVLDNGPKKHSKWPIVLAILALVAVIGGVVGYFVVKNLPGQTVQETPQEAFNSYFDIIKNGPENAPTIDDAAGSIANADDWFLLRLSTSVLQKSELESYIKEVTERYAKFISLFNTESARTYQATLRAYLDLNNLQELSDELTAKYLNESPNAAYTYIQEFSVPEGATSLEESSMTRLREYLESELALVSIAEANNCVVDKTIDDFCRENLIESSDAYLDELSKQQSIANILSGLSVSLGNNLRARTNLMQEELKHAQ